MEFASQAKIALWLLNIICVSSTTVPKLGILIEKHVWQDDLNNISRTVFQTVEELYPGPAYLETIELQDGNPFSAADAVCTLVEKECQVIISFVRCTTAKLLSSRKEFPHVPQIFFIDEACRLGRPCSNCFVFQYHYNVFGKIAASLIYRMKWVDVILIHDASLNALEIHEFLSLISRGYTRSRLFNLSNGQTESLENRMRRVLSTVSQLTIPTFVHLEGDTFDIFFEQVRNQCLLNQKYFWILMCSKTGTNLRHSLKVQEGNVVVITRDLPGAKPPLNQCLQRSEIEMQVAEGAKAIAIYISSRYGSTYYNELTWQDHRIKRAVTGSKFDAMMGPCQREIDELIMYDALKLSLDLIHNYQTSHNGSLTEISRCLYPPDNFQIQSREISMYIAASNMNGRSGKISFDEFQYLRNGNYTIEAVGANMDNSTLLATWTGEDGLVISDESFFHSDFYNFASETLLISTQEMRPFVQKEIRNNETVWGGMCIDILNELARTLNFKYTVVEPTDGMWGGPNDDGSWNGIVGQVYRREVKFGVGPLTITALRERVIDFTKPFLEDGVGIITKRKTDDSGKFFKIFQPFQYNVWIFTGVAILATGIALFVTNRFSPLSQSRQKEVIELDKATLNSSLWLVFGTYMEQGGEPQPNAASGRIVLAFWWIFTLLMASTYTANLAAFLTVTISKRPINSMAELVAQTEVKANVLYGTNLYDAFENANDSLYKEIWRDLVDAPKLKQMEEQLALVRTGKYAFVSDRLTLEHIANTNCDSYSLADKISNTAGYGFVLPENAAYMDAFNYNIIKMQESGLIAKWRKKWWSEAESCSDHRTQSGADVLDLECIGGLFVIYGVVCCSSVLCLFIEIILLVRNNKTKRKVDQDMEETKNTEKIRKTKTKKIKL